MKVYVERTEFSDEPKVYAECERTALLNSIVVDLVEEGCFNEAIEETWSGELDRFYKLMLTDEGRAQARKVIADYLMDRAIDRLEQDYDLIEVQG